jgi:hypothetical protein
VYWQYGGAKRQFPITMFIIKGSPEALSHFRKKRCNNESQGKAETYNQIRSRLQNIYKETHKNILKSVKNHAGFLSNKFITFSLDNKILIGDMSRVTRSSTLVTQTFNNSSIFLVEDNHILPVVPFLEDVNNLAPDQEQGLRQWIRAVIGQLYRVDAMSDAIIYLTMSIALTTSISQLNQETKNCFKQLSIAMLKKKLPGSEKTLLASIEAGDLPFVSNSNKTSEFNGYMQLIAQNLNLKLNALSVWFLLCLSTQNETIIAKQWMHCEKFILEDMKITDRSRVLAWLKEHFYENINKQLTNFKQVDLVELDERDYTCQITLEDISKVGGYKFKPHMSLTNILCKQNYSLSEDGYKLLLSQPADRCVCPVCYANINAIHLEKIGAKLEVHEVKIFDENFINPFGANKINQEIKVKIRDHNIKQNKFLVLQKGTVGAGKTTFSENLQQQIVKLGGKCVIISTDNYCKDNVTNMKVAVNNVMRDLQRVEEFKEEFLVVIVDTCNEKVEINKMFGHNFSHFEVITCWPNLTDNFVGYLSWSLTNVLLRKMSDKNSNFWLNPKGAGVDTCITVHNKKSSSHFSNDKAKNKILNSFYKEILGKGFTEELALEKLRGEAETYAKSLKTVDEEVGVIVASIKAKYLIFN